MPDTDIGDYNMKIGICGSFGGKKGSLDGQTVKTKIITNELEHIFSSKNILKVDTFGGIKKLFAVLFKLLIFSVNCDHIIVLPAQNSLRLVAPFLYYAKKFFKCKTHYIVIGGWLPDLLLEKKWLCKYVKSFDNIFVETYGMKKKIDDIISADILVMPNCKPLNILKVEELPQFLDEPFALCTFSRVMKEKGIEEAVNAVTTVNNELGRTAYTLDIYGQIDLDQVEWFEELQKNFPEYVKYKGLVAFDKSSEVLKNYFALLFPTYYEGEGFAGTLIDAMASGVPVIASDWKYNGEIVSDDIGFLFNSDEELKTILCEMLNNINGINELKKNCIKKSQKYTAKNVVYEFVKNI